MSAFSKDERLFTRIKHSAQELLDRTAMRINRATLHQIFGACFRALPSKAKSPPARSSLDADWPLVN
jgi:hypothetical protein